MNKVVAGSGQMDLTSLKVTWEVNSERNFVVSSWLGFVVSVSALIGIPVYIFGSDGPVRYFLAVCGLLASICFLTLVRSTFSSTTECFQVLDDKIMIRRAFPFYLLTFPEPTFADFFRLVCFTSGSLTFRLDDLNCIEHRVMPNGYAGIYCRFRSFDVPLVAGEGGETTKIKNYCTLVTNEFSRFDKAGPHFDAAENSGKKRSPIRTKPTH